MATNITLRSREWVKILDLLGEGEIEGLVDGEKSIYFDDVPILDENGKYNIEDVHFDFRGGKAQQGNIPEFTAAVSVEDVNEDVTKEYKKDGDIIVEGNQPEYIIIEPNTDSVMVTLEFEGLYYSGVTDLNPKTVNFDIEYRKYGDSTSGKNGDGWDYIPFVDMEKLSSDDQGTYAGSYVRVGGTSSITNFAVNNYGAEISVIWDRTLAEQYDDENVTFSMYNGTYVTLDIYARKHGEAWPTTPNKTVNVNMNTGYTYTRSGLRKGAGIYSPYVFYPIYFEFEDEAQYDYKAQFIATDDKGSIFDDVEPTIRILPTASRIETTDSLRIKGTATSPFRQDYKFNLYNCDYTDFPITIRVTRLTDEDEKAIDDNTDDDSGFEHVSSFKVSSVSKFVDQKFTYPNSSLMGITFSAEAYDTIPKRSYDLKLLKVKIPTNYDPISRNYDGFWNGCFKTEWTDNPAWCLYDLMTNERYGIGQYTKDESQIDPCNQYPMVDKWALYEVSKFCDELVSTAYGSKKLKEPRFTCNVYLTQQEEAFVLLRNLASIFRGMLFWMDNKLTTVYDHPTDTVDIIFSNSNVENGLFTYSGSSKDTRFNTVYVSWSDPTIRNENAIEYVEDTADIANRGIFSTDLVALGCTSRGQAYRAGKWLLYAETETVVFTSSIDNIRCKPGDLIEIYDKFRANVRYSGRVYELYDTGIILDHELELKSGIDYKLRLVSKNSNTFIRGDGTSEELGTPKLEEFDITINNVNKTRIQLGSSFDSSLYPESTIWTISEANLNPQIFRVVSIVEQAMDKYEINALEFNQSKLDFIEKDEVKELTVPIYRQNFNGTTPLISSDIFITEKLKSTGNIVVNEVTISWDKLINTNIQEFIVEYKYSKTNDTDIPWTYLGKTKNNSIKLDVAPEGYYTARVYIVLSSGSIMQAVESNTVHMLGKSMAPRNVENFISSITSQGIRLTWDAVPDLDIAHYEIQDGTSWDDDSNFREIVNNIYYDLISYTNRNLMIKAVDSSGNKSVIETKINVDYVNPTIINYSGTFTDFGYLLDWQTVKGTFPIDYTEVRYGGTSFETSNFQICKTLADTFSVANFINWPADEITMYYRIYDNLGAFTNGTYTQAYNKIYLTNITKAGTTETVTVSWDVNTPSFALRHTEIRLGENLDSSIYKNKTTGDSITITMSYAEQDIVFWLVPVDISGARGEPSTFSISPSNTQGGGVEQFPVDITTNLFDSSDIYTDGARRQNSIYLEEGSDFLFAPIYSPSCYGDNDPSGAQEYDTWNSHFINYGYTSIADHIENNPSSTFYITEDVANEYGGISYNEFEIVFDEAKAPTFTMEVDLDYSLIQTLDLKGNPHIFISCKFYNEAGNLAYYDSTDTETSDSWYMYEKYSHAPEDIPIPSGYANDAYLDNIDYTKANSIVIDTANVSNIDPLENGSGAFNSDVKSVKFLVKYDSPVETQNNLVNNGYFTTGVDNWIGFLDGIVSHNAVDGSLRLESQIKTAKVGSTVPIANVNLGLTDYMTFEVTGKVKVENQANVNSIRVIAAGSSVGSLNLFTANVIVTSPAASHNNYYATFLAYITINDYIGDVYITLRNSNKDYEVAYWDDIEYLEYTNKVTNGYFFNDTSSWASKGSSILSLTEYLRTNALNLDYNNEAQSGAENTTPMTTISIDGSTSLYFKIQGVLYMTRASAVVGNERTILLGTAQGLGDLGEYKIPIIAKQRANLINADIRVSSITGYTGDVYLTLVGPPIIYTDPDVWDNIECREYTGASGATEEIASHFLALKNMQVTVTNNDNIVITT